jgi:hypothetical protein
MSDTVFVGPGSWPGEPPPPDFGSWGARIPGYIGLAPFQNDAPEYGTYLQKLRQYEAARGLPVSDHVYKYGSEAVDAVVALALALSSLPSEQRANGSLVRAAIQNTRFDGVSGHVEFDANGDRKDPMFTLVNLGPNQQWRRIGNVGPSADSINLQSICWAGRPLCGGEVPADKYPSALTPQVITNEVPAWVWNLIGCGVVVIGALLTKYHLSRKSKEKLKQGLRDAFKEVDDELGDITQVLEKAKKRQQELLQRRMGINDVNLPDTWSDEPPDGGGSVLVELEPDDVQYWDVSDQLQAAMGDAWISRLWRVQNKALWNFFSFHKSRLAQNNLNELQVWHGTGGLDPAMVYTDRQDGFSEYCLLFIVYCFTEYLHPIMFNLVFTP